ncbi:MAG: NAD(P)/FAD-dependent oxidoreductase [Myxococcota bacterium]
MRVVIAGGGYAGVMAAGRLAGRAGLDSVTLVDATGVQIQRTRLHQMVRGTRPRQVDLAMALEPLGVRVVRDRVQHIGPDRLALQQGGELQFDRLILALGSQFCVPEALAGAHRLSDPTAARALGQAARGAAVVTVIGAGLTGLELATELACMGASRVHLVTSGRVGGDLCPGAERSLRRRLSRLGIVLMEGGRVDAVEAGSVRIDGSRHPSDVSVWTGGMRASPVVATLGAPVDAQGRLRVNSRLKLEGTGVYSVGDAAFVDGKPWLKMSCAAAMPMGAHAADNILREASGQSTLGLDLGLVMRLVGLGGGHGLVQFTDGQDRPTDRWIAGRVGHWMKEAILGYTMLVPALERRGLRRLYRWPRGPRRVERHPAPVGRLYE